MKLRGACFTVVMLAACKPAPVAGPAGPAEPAPELAPVAAAPPCVDVAPVPSRLAGELVTTPGMEPPAGLAPQLLLEDTLRAGTAVRAAIDPGEIRVIDKVELRAEGITLDVDRFNRAEVAQKPRERLVTVRPLAFDVSGGVAGPALIEAAVWWDGRMYAVRWPLTVAAADAGRCPPPAPSALTVQLAGDDEDGPPRVRMWYTRPPQVGVPSLLHLELRPPEALDTGGGGPWSLSYVTNVKPPPDEALGIAGPATGEPKKLRPRWVGDSRIAFDLPITPTRAGDLPLSATVQLFLCGATICRIAQPYQLTTTVPVAAQNGPAMPR